MDNSQVEGQLGPLTVALSGNNPLRGIIASLLQGTNLEGTADVSIVFPSQLHPPSGPECVRAGATVIAPSLVYTKARGVNLSLCLQGQRPTLSLQKDLHRTRCRVRSRLKTLRQHGSLDAHDLELRWTLLSYHLFWSVFQLLLLNQGYSFVHSSMAVKHTGDGIMLCSAGGGGKTTAALALVQKHGYGYLADDLGIINSTGLAWQSPRPMTVYASDLQRLPKEFESRFLRWMPKFERHLWRLTVARGCNPRRQIAASELLGAKQCVLPVRITDAFFLIRCSSKQVEVREASHKDFADRALNASMRELYLLHEVCQQVAAVAPQLMPTLCYDYIREQTRTIYVKALEGVRLYWLEMPFHADPRAVADSIARHAT